MRLDKFISEMGYSRKDAEIFIKRKKITVNGNLANKKDEKVDENNDIICLDGKILNYSKYIYIMINKPTNILSATEDKNQKTVISLLPENLQKKNLFPVGRLDKDTLGLLLLTNDGNFCHKMISPKSNISKIYKFELADDIDNCDIQKIQNGIELKDGYKTLPCTIQMIDKKSGQITITEGKYHQIRRMFGAVGNKVVYLERISEGTIVLDANLKRGEWRYLSQQELSENL
jgi:16S rRNA pseudouridine516 synthase